MKKELPHDRLFHFGMSRPPTQWRLFRLLFSVLVWTLFPGTMGRASAESINAEAQERVAELIQNALGSYRVESALRSGATNNALSTLTNIEAGFREASMLMPNRLDLRFGIASALVGQALQTNAPFKGKMKSALKVYEEIHALDTNGFQAPILYAAYARAIGETNASESTLTALAKVHPERARAYREKFRRIDEIERMIPNMEPHTMARSNGTNAIVILGAGLETNGMMKAKLFGRLRQGLVVARLYPEAPIIVTGGNQKGGVTEAYVMSQWLVNEGVRTNRLHLEDRATDTLGNAVRSCGILQKLGATHVTLVTSSSHIRRALAIFEETARKRGLSMEFSHLASKDEPESELDEGRERVAIYRDVMRASGIWTYPGIQR
jgi:uncharacterized SAM-binding protein YcdF (DUF218 family)